MFDFAPAELLVLGAVAIVVIPPKDLPKAMRVVGYWVGRLRNVAGQFRSGFDTMVREAELQEMEKKWAAENERIMRDHPPSSAVMLPMTPTVEMLEGDTPEMVTQPIVTAPPEPVPSAGAQEDLPKANP